MPLLRVVRGLIERRRAALRITAQAVQAGVPEASPARSSLPGRLAGARGPADLDPSGAEVVIGCYPLLPRISSGTAPVPAG